MELNMMLLWGPLWCGGCLSLCGCGSAPTLNFISFTVGQPTSATLRAHLFFASGWRAKTLQIWCGRKTDVGSRVTPCGVFVAWKPNPTVNSKYGS